MKTEAEIRNAALEEVRIAVSILRGNLRNENEFFTVKWMVLLEVIDIIDTLKTPSIGSGTGEGSERDSLRQRGEG